MAPTIPQFGQVSDKDVVSAIKLQVQQKLDVPISCQRLVHRGKPLSDDWPLNQCGVKDGTKLFLVVKKEDVGTSGGDSGTPRLNLWDELHYFLLKHYHQADAKVIREHFKSNFQHSVDCLSLDDIERIGALQLKKKDT